ncbi:hypothetical protein D5281_07175 [bacterium 1xD42-62]|uniref:Uncharacterized protein n=1 Tax=Parablautia muri TaxID=2320879 RepID=A0A9X5BER6_9FIRM|nr:hypothetical protein [Parablautia muri]
MRSETWNITPNVTMSGSQAVNSNQRMLGKHGNQFSKLLCANKTILKIDFRAWKVIKFVLRLILGYNLRKYLLTIRKYGG